MRSLTIKNYVSQIKKNGGFIMKTKLFVVLALISLLYGFSATASAENKNELSYISVITPNSSTLLRNDESSTITWTDNIDGNVRIELYKDGEMVWIVSYTTSAQEYSMYLNSSYQGTYRLKIFDLDNPDVYAWSEYFYVSDRYFHDHPCGSDYLDVYDHESWKTVCNEDLDDSEVGNPGYGYNPDGEFGDYWLHFTAPETGMVDLMFQQLDGQPENWAVAVYENECNNLNLIGIDDNSGEGLLPALSFDNLVPGDLYYVRVWENNCDDFGSVRMCVLKTYPPMIETIIKPTNSTHVYAGGMMEVKWSTKAIDFSEIIKITTIADGVVSYVTCPNYRILTIPVPDISQTVDNAIISVSLLDDPNIYAFSEEFTIDVTQKYDLVLETFEISSNIMQQGENVSILAEIYNNGNLDYNGAVAIKLLDENGNEVSVLSNYTDAIEVGETVEVWFSNQAIVSDIGDFTIDVEYFDVNKGSLVLATESIEINGLDVSGVEISEVMVNDENPLSSLVISPSQQDPPLLSILSITNNSTKTTEYVFLDEVSNQSNGDGEESEFELNYAFTEAGEYDLQYIGLYNWEGKGFDAKNPTWYYSYGDVYQLLVSELLKITDLTNYPPIIYKGITSFTGDNAFKIRVDNYDPDQTITVEAIFTRDGFDPVSLPMSNYYDNVWVLEKDYMSYVGIYDLEYRVSQNGFTNSVFTSIYSRGIIGTIIEDGIVNTPGEFAFSFENYGINIASAQIRFFTPDHNIVYKDLTNAFANMYILYDTKLRTPGYYAYRYLVTATDGTEIESDAYRVFASFGNDCSVLERPGLVLREKWCPGCYSTNENNGTPTHIVIHHSVTPNYDDSYGRVFNIRNDHLAIGDPDIGYHYLIGSDGRIYEGLQGGPDKKGYHFSGMNSHTIGVCLLGTFHDGEINGINYTGIQPTEEALKSLDLLLEWLCSEYQINPTGIENHYYPGGVNANMPQIAPHNIVNNYGGSTACPGNLFPDIVTEITPNVFYCPSSSSHQPVELNSDIIINSGNSKGRTLVSDTVSISSSAIILEGNTFVRFRAILYDESDTLIIGETDFFELIENTTQDIFLSGIVELEAGNEYLLKVEYNINDHEEWNMVLSETFDNDFLVNVEELLSVKKQKQNNYVIYPNPSTGTVFIEFDEIVKNGNISVVDVIGTTIRQKNVNGTNRIVLQKLYPGIYFIHLEQNGQTTTEKVIVYWHYS